MLGKLVKYELKTSSRLIPLAYVAVILLLIAGAILSATKAYVFMLISFALLFLAGAAAMIITYVIVFLRFYKGMYGGEGYLAMTLPVTSAQLYFSKTIVAFFWLFLSTVVTTFSWIASFAMLFRFMFSEVGVTPGDLEQLEMLYRGFLSPNMIAFLTVSCLVGFLAFIAQVYFCVTIANVKPFQSMGIGAAIIAFVVIEIINQILGVVLQFSVPLSLAFDPYAGWSLTNQTYSLFYQDYNSLGFTMGLGAYLPSILFAFALPFLTVWLIKRKVNLK